MKIAVFVILSLTIILLAGCGERNSPLVPEPYYRLVSEIQTPGWALDVAVLNDTAYVADDMGGIAVIDVRDASNPIFIESLPAQLNVKNIMVAPSNRLIITYEIQNSGGIKIYSVDSKQPVGEGFDLGMRDMHLLETMGSLWIIETDYNDRQLRGALFEYQGGLWLINEGLEPIPPPLGEYRGFALTADSVVFVCLEQRGIVSYKLDLIQVVNPPDSLGHIETPGAAYDAEYQDGYLYVADYFGGLVVIDASDPASMSQVAQVIPRGADRCEKVIVDGDRLALMDIYDGVFVFDISIPDAPAMIDHIFLPEPSGMIFSGGRLLITDEVRGLLIYQP